jgi:hypothetical protein
MYDFMTEYAARDWPLFEGELGCFTAINLDGTMFGASFKSHDDLVESILDLIDMDKIVYRHTETVIFVYVNDEALLFIPK